MNIRKNLPIVVLIAVIMVTGCADTKELTAAEETRNPLISDANETDAVIIKEQETQVIIGGI